ncbi:MAG TPA: DUF6457 domain-containing protein [Acidimicrobiales bacterium]|nr:DUF6457 domain-containing protein [Acidimicrobiales bacterium]
MAFDARTFTDCYAAALGVDALSEADVEAVLDLAGTAAHASERTAAPLSCWLAATSGLTPAEALAAARDVAESLRGI